jgi:hypothetical protein
MSDEPTAQIIQLFPGRSRDQIAEGLRLIKAFMLIKDSALRDALLAFAERMAEPPAKDKP